MKSYSNDIPNISTEELKRTALTTEEINQLVKDNLTAIEKVEKQMNTHFKLIIGTIIISTIILISVLTFLSQ
jgi:hypothetical protein